MKQLKIVGIAGKAGAGKDFMARHLQRCLEFMPLGFADPLKIELMVREGFGINDMFGDNRSEHARTRMQQYGNDEMKSEFGDDVWINYAEARVNVLYERMGADRFVFADMRFEVEAQWVREHGGLIIRLIGDEPRSNMTAEQNAHVSETELDGIDADVVIQNGRDWRESSALLLLSRTIDWLETLKPIPTFTPLPCVQ